MIRLDMYNEVDIVNALPPVSASTTQTSDAAKLNGFESAVVTFNCGVLTNGSFLPSLLESLNGSTYTAVAAGSLIGAPVVLQGGKSVKLGYKGQGCAIKGVLTLSGGPPLTVASVTVTSSSGTFNSGGTHPITQDVAGTVNDTWTVTFTSATAFRVSGAATGSVGTGTRSVSFAPTNLASASPYFTIPSTAWGGTYAANDTVVFKTLATSGAVVGATVTSSAGTFDNFTYPILQDLVGTVTDTWTVTFSTSTAFSVAGAETGSVGSGTVSSNFAPDNSGHPYFTINKNAWGGTYAGSDTVVFETVAIAGAIVSIEVLRLKPVFGPAGAYCHSYIP